MRKKNLIFFHIFLKSPESCLVAKNVKRVPLGVVAKKLKGGPFEDIVKVCEKKSLKAEIHANKILVRSETRTHVLLLDRPQKILMNLYAKCQ